MGDFLFSTLSACFNPFFVACFLMPVVFAAYETDAIEHSWSSKEMMREEERTSRCVAACPISSDPHTKQTHLLHIHTYSNFPILQGITAYLICGNWGSSDEGRDGGLCDHAVGGDAVRRGVEPKKGKRKGDGRKRKEMV